MTMRTGYVSLDYTTCVSAATVGDCFQTASTHTAVDDDLFFYQGGHFQKYAVDLGLGADDNTALAAEIASQTGVHTTPAMFATFLQRVLSGALALKDHLGDNAVCTLPSACSAAVSSPVPEAWHYRGATGSRTRPVWATAHSRARARSDSIHGSTRPSLTTACSRAIR